jgi:hypothetical protein
VADGFRASTPSSDLLLLLLPTLLPGTAGSLVYEGYPNSPDAASSSSCCGPTAFPMHSSSGTATAEAATTAHGDGCGKAAGFDAAADMQPANTDCASPTVPCGVDSACVEPPLHAADGKTLAAAWKQLQPRYFTPAEIARLHSFPGSFTFSGDMDPRQCYKLLGNSLSVAVVADLLKFLLLSESSQAGSSAAAGAGGA